MAATTGFGAASMVLMTSCNEGSAGGRPNSVMSAPAMKVRAAQLSTMAWTDASAEAVSMACLMPWRTAADSAFTGGEFTVSTATPSCVVRSITSLTWVMFSSLLPPGCGVETYVAHDVRGRPGGPGG